MELASRSTAITSGETFALRFAWIAGASFFLLTLLAIAGWFQRETVLAVLGLGLVSVVVGGIRCRCSLRWRSWGMGALMVGAVFVSGLLIFFHDFSLGRDDMGYLVSAQRLIETGNLAWEDVLSRPLHSVRQISGDVFTSQFLPLYPSLLSVPIMFVGAEEVGIVNAVLWALGLMMIYFVGRRLGLGTRSPELVGFLSVAAVASVYTSFWFSHRVNSENVLFFLFWFAVLLVLRGLQERRPVELILALFPLTLAMLSRGEALILLIGWLALGSLAIAWKKIEGSFEARRAVAASVFSLLPVAAFVWYAHRYQAVYFLDQSAAMLTAFELLQRPMIWVGALVAIALFFVFRRRWKGRWDQRRRALLVLIGFLLIEAMVFGLAVAQRLPWSVFRIQYVMETWLWYFLFPWVGLFWWAALRRRLPPSIGVLLLLVAPLAILILQPNIALDQPWFMRRYFSILVPFFLIGGVVALTSIFSGKALGRFAIALLGLNLLIAAPVVAFEDHAGIAAQLHAWASEFSPNDLLLMRPGWGWQKWALPLAAFEGVNVLPNDDVVRDEVFIKQLPELEKQFPKWKGSDADLLGIYNVLLGQRAMELKTIIASYDRIFVMTDTQSRIHPYFEETQLTFVKPLPLKIVELSAAARVTGFVRQFEQQLPLSELRGRIGSLPPRAIETTNATFYLYEVSGPTDLLQTQYAITVDQAGDLKSFERPERNVQVLSPQDVIELRRWMTRIKRMN